AILDRRGLSNELVHPRLIESSVSFAIDVSTVGVTWRLAIDQNAKSNARAPRPGAHDQMQVPRVERIGDLAARAVEDCGFAAYRPAALERPGIEPQYGGSRINARQVEDRSPG